MIDLEELRALVAGVRAYVGEVIVGKTESVDLLLIALMSEGHVLLEDVPGIGKTTMAKALAHSLGVSFQRIQFTPDLLPSDVTGVSVFDQRTADFSFHPGPIFAGVVLADEINRAGPRTQSALLEAMEERQVTVDRVCRSLPRPFMVLATQNPVELEGTFPLPEAQLDRFMMRVTLGYPAEAEEIHILRRFRKARATVPQESVASQADVLEMQRQVGEVFVHPIVESYVVHLMRATRAHAAIQLGASPRATLALVRACQARALLQGRTYVLPDDVQALLSPVVCHRLIISSRARVRGQSAVSILQEITATVPVPAEESWSVAEV
jgi:MoxR-like ATPase